LSSRLRLSARLIPRRIVFTRIRSGANHPRHALAALVSRFARLQPRISDINQNLEPEFTASSPSGFRTVPPCRPPSPFGPSPPSPCPLPTPSNPRSPYRRLLVHGASYVGVIRSRKNVAASRRCGASAVYRATSRRAPILAGPATFRPKNQLLGIFGYLPALPPALSFGHLP
jgi:hypothetical protein